MKSSQTQGLNKGNPGNKGGGRPADWLKAKCQAIIEKKKLIEWLGDVAEGKDVEQQTNQNGKVLRVPASVKDRLRAMEMLTDRAWGKPAQALEAGESLKEFARTFILRAKND